MKFFECVDIVGQSVKQFDGKKKYISTGAVDVDKIDEVQVEYVDYRNKPSRANIEVKSGDILFAKMQNTKKILVIDKNSQEHIYSTGFFAVRPRKNIITDRCLYHLLCSEQFLNQKDKNCSGATQKAITNTGLSKIEIKIPDIDVQVEVTDKLDKLTDLIKKRKQQLQKLDELVKARFVEMFGDVIHNDMGWSKFVFSDITTSRLGKMLDKKQQTGRYKFPYLANFNVQWFRFELNNLNEMDFDENDQIEFELNDGDLLICEGGEIGRCAVWHDEIQPCFFQKALHRVRCKLNIIKPDYLARWFQYNCEHGGFSSIEGAKATIAHLPGVKLKSLQVAVPPIELQEIFCNFTTRVDELKSAVQNSMDKLELLKKALMQEYFG